MSEPDDALKRRQVIYVSARHVGISGEAMDRFIGTIQQCGFDILPTDLALRALAPAPAESCNRCSGTGKISAISFQDATKQIERTCPICKGKGHLAGGTPET